MTPFRHSTTDLVDEIAALRARVAELERVETERREAEQALREKARRTQEDLAHVLRVATVGEMASGLAHELNQPLAAIINYIQGAKRRIESNAIGQGELLEALDKVAAQAQRAATILRTVRSYITRRVPGPSRWDLSAAAGDAVKLAELDIRDRQVRLELSLAAGLPAVEGDPVQVQQVILNLIRNGIEAMEAVPAGRRSLHVLTRRSGEAEVELVIRDTGPGVPAEQAQRVFDPFFTTKKGGLGMGLSISRSIIESHRGRIWLAGGGGWAGDGSAPPSASGAEFHFTLPAGRTG